jgi:hypothetical protein
MLSRGKIFSYSLLSIQMTIVGQNGSRWFAVSFPSWRREVWFHYFALASPCTTFLSPRWIVTGSLQSHESLWSFIRRSRRFASRILARICGLTSRFLKRLSRFLLRCRAFLVISDVYGARQNQLHQFQMGSTQPNQKSSEPTAVGACSSAIAVHITSWR